MQFCSKAVQKSADLRRVPNRSSTAINTPTLPNGITVRSGLSSACALTKRRQMDRAAAVRPAQGVGGAAPPGVQVVASGANGAHYFWRSARAPSGVYYVGAKLGNQETIR